MPVVNIETFYNPEKTIDRQALVLGTRIVCWRGGGVGVVVLIEYDEIHLKINILHYFISNP